MNDNEVLRLKNISFSYKGRGQIFRNINLSVNEKDFVVIRGPSGSGKSTLLRLINRLYEPESGTIFFRKRSIKGFEVTSLRKKICYIQQIPVMIDSSIKENIKLPFLFKSSKKNNLPSDEKIREILDEFLLNDLKLTDNALKLSIGEKQRVALIRVLLLNPEIVLLDEPTSALDQKAKKMVENIIEKINIEKSVAVVVVTHIGFSPEKINPRTFILSDGNLNKEGINDYS